MSGEPHEGETVADALKHVTIEDEEQEQELEQEKQLDLMEAKGKSQPPGQNPFMKEGQPDAKGLETNDVG